MEKKLLKGLIFCPFPMILTQYLPTHTFLHLLDTPAAAKFEIFLSSVYTCGMSNRGKFFKKNGTHELRTFLFQVLSWGRLWTYKQFPYVRQTIPGLTPPMYPTVSFFVLMYLIKYIVIMDSSNWTHNQWRVTISVQPCSGSTRRDLARLGPFFALIHYIPTCN